MTWFLFIRYFTHDLSHRSYPTVESGGEFGATKLYTIVEHANGRIQALNMYQEFTIIQNYMREPMNPQLKEPVLS